MSDDRFMLHLLVSRENGAQLVALPLIRGIPQDRLREVVERFLLLENSEVLGHISDDALDAALRETSDSSV